VDFSKNRIVRPANLPKEKETCKQFGKQMYASGWGYNQYDESKPDKLWTVKQECLAAIDCADRKNINAGSGWFEEDTMICVGDKETPDNSACKGDSGGPLTHTKDEITTVYGITHGPGSFPECAATAIFTKVSAPEILNWITKVTGVLPLGYQLLEKNSQCQNEGGTHLLEHQCRQIAASMGPYVKFRGTEVKANYPMGCYLFKGRQVWFNRHPNGSKDKRSSPICKIHE